jgi:transcription elongation factor GreA
MNEPTQSYLTSAGAERLKAELEQLKGPARDELAKRLRSAIQMGDLSENADYHKAKEDQAFLEGRIQELEFLLKNAIIVEESAVARDEVAVGVRVTVQEDEDPPETYQLVGAKEADPRNGKISNESPIGKALMGGRVGEVVVAQTPNGTRRMKILKIE